MRILNCALGLASMLITNGAAGAANSTSGLAPIASPSLLFRPPGHPALRGVRDEADPSSLPSIEAWTNGTRTASSPSLVSDATIVRQRAIETGVGSTARGSNATLCFGDSDEGVIVKFMGSTAPVVAAIPDIEQKCGLDLVDCGDSTLKKNMTACPETNTTGATVAFFDESSGARASCAIDQIACPKPGGSSSHQLSECCIAMIAIAAVLTAMALIATGARCTVVVV